MSKRNSVAQVFPEQAIEDFELRRPRLSCTNARAQEGIDNKGNKVNVYESVFNTFLTKDVLLSLEDVILHVGHLILHVE